MTIRHFVLASLLSLFSFTAAFSNVVSDGYTDQRSYNPGDTVKIYVNGLGTFVHCQMDLMDINGVVVDSILTNVAPQAPTINDPWQDGYGYSLTATYIIPSTLKSGVYGWENLIFFVVKSALKNADITLVYPTNTEEAYSPAGGKSLYDYNSSGGRSHIVSFHRPYSAWMIQAVRGFSTGYLKWFNTLSGYSVQMIADIDMEDYAEIQASKILVIVGHSEYWTRTARQNFDLFVNNGKDAVVLSGNTMWWQVRYSSDKTQLICYKDSSLDPEQDTSMKTVTWPTSYLHYSVLGSIGADWPHGAYANQSAFHGYYGYKILLPNSPLLAGTALSFHSFVNCMANEDDGTLFYGFDSNGDPIVDTTTLGFCKMELIGYDWGESIYYPSAPQIGYGTFIAFKKSPTSGNIINVGNSNWCSINTGSSTGGFAGSDVAIIKTVSLNMINLLLAGSSIYSTPLICVPLTVENVKNPVNGCKVFPNPTSGELSIHLDSPSENNNVLEIFNPVGQLVQSKSLLNANEQQVDLSELSDGTYFYTIKRENEIISRGKIILAR